MKHVRMLGVDPSKTNFGMARLLINIEGKPFIERVERLVLIKTEPDKDKKVRKASSDLARARDIVEAFHDEADGCICIGSEVPSGGKSASAVHSFGMVIGILASAPVPVMEVTPREVKMATVGRAGAAKEDMIEWAMSRFPDAGDGDPDHGWRYAKSGKTKGQPTADNEHLADAVCVGAATILTPQFLQTIYMLRGATRLVA